uniref:Uncharacterized protein n=1 Tax=Magallana gigas TaxID=29159 RepID=K1QIQ2_MAGGI
MGNKLEFNCQYKVQGMEFTPLCLDYWYNPKDANEAILCWGDVGGFVNCLFFNSANIALFERPPAPAGEKQGSARSRSYPMSEVIVCLLYTAK